MQLNMSEQELRNLQIYISKRNQGQTDEQVINHITKINSKTPLTQDIVVQLSRHKFNLFIMNRYM